MLILLCSFGSVQVILMAGLQGVGKTTACGKLALYLQKQGKKVSACAVRRTCLCARPAVKRWHWQACMAQRVFQSGKRITP